MQSQFYEMYARTSLFRNKLERTIKKIRNIDRNKKVMVLYSGGKDSTVVLDLLLRYCKGHLHEFHFDWGPLIPRNIEYDIHSVFMKIFEKYPGKEIKGHNFKQKKETALSGKKEGDDKLFFTKLNYAIKKNKIDIVLSSLRMEESIKRKNILTNKKTLFGAENRHIIKEWKTEDIWAYIFSNRLPYLSWYDRPDKRLSVFFTDGFTNQFNNCEELWHREVFEEKHS